MNGVLLLLGSLGFPIVVERSIGLIAARENQHIYMVWVRGGIPHPSSPSETLLLSDFVIVVIRPVTANPRHHTQALPPDLNNVAHHSTKPVSTFQNFRIVVRSTAQ